MVKENKVNFALNEEPVPVARVVMPGAMTRVLANVPPDKPEKIMGGIKWLTNNVALFIKEK